MLPNFANILLKEIPTENAGIKLSIDKRELYEQLRKMLSLADLVKFAKWTTTPDENELSLRSAYTFVKETTIQSLENGADAPVV